MIGTRDRVMPRAPANFMVDSLNNERVSASDMLRLTGAAGSTAMLENKESSLNLGYPQFCCEIVKRAHSIKNDSQRPRDDNAAGEGNCVLRR
jgi:hypothetical protein